MSSARKVNLNDVLIDPTQSVEFTLIAKPRETDLERDHRLTRQTDDARHGRWKELFILIGVLAGIAIILAVCVFLVVSPNAPPEDKKWATAILASIVTGGMGYLVGKKEASKSS